MQASPSPLLGPPFSQADALSILTSSVSSYVPKISYIPKDSITIRLSVSTDNKRPLISSLAFTSEAE